ncbi:MAG: hypothetical protein ACI8Z1_001987 [Candidatus Azotimanducaceae bacterium]|jgi:hypothetical protein
MNTSNFWKKLQRWAEVIELSTQNPHLELQEIQRIEIEELKARVRNLEAVDQI